MICKGGIDIKPDLIVFPDASVKRYGKDFSAGYGAVILNTENHKYTRIGGSLSKSSVVYCEAWAIYQSLRFIEYLSLKSKKSKNKNILIVSDSKINVQILTEYLKNWDTSDSFNWKKADHKPVQNQEIYRGILRILSTGKYKIRIIHMNSHADTKKGLRGHIEAKLKKAKVSVNEKTLDIFIQMNCLADKTANEAADMRTSDKKLFLMMERKE